MDIVLEGRLTMQCHKSVWMISQSDFEPLPENRKVWDEPRADKHVYPIIFKDSFRGC